jgi:hypothetical protein
MCEVMANLQARKKSTGVGIVGLSCGLFATTRTAVAVFDDFWSSSYIIHQLVIELCELETTLSYTVIQELSKQEIYDRSFTGLLPALRRGY